MGKEEKGVIIEVLIKRNISIDALIRNQNEGVTYGYLNGCRQQRVFWQIFSHAAHVKQFYTILILFCTCKDGTVEKQLPNV